MTHDVMPCPFCGEAPRVRPVNATDGNAFGWVRCDNPACHARPVVDDGEPYADDRGIAAYNACAIKRWNRRV